MVHVVISRQPPARWWTGVGLDQIIMLPYMPVQEPASTANGKVENVGSGVDLNCRLL